jgi:DMSO/TMAO reductase YedYZ molybdopterin-dependent catalytic subunit
MTLINLRHSRHWRLTTTFIGNITPSSLHFVGTHRGAIVPDIKPGDYRLLLHGIVDRPLEFTLEELKRFPSVSHIHFLECLGTARNPNTKQFGKLPA